MPNYASLRLAQYLSVGVDRTGTGALSGAAGALDASGAAVPPVITGTGALVGGAGVMDASGGTGDTVGSGALVGGSGVVAATGGFALPGLAALWDATLISGNDGDAIATWPDTSGNARDFTQATGASRPTLRKGSNGINGLAVVSMDGGDSMATGSFLDTSFDQSTTLYIVFRRMSASSTQRLFTTGSNKILMNLSGSQALRGSGGSSYRAYTATGSAVSVVPGMTSPPAIQNVMAGAANTEAAVASWTYDGANAIIQANGIENAMWGAGTAATGNLGATGGVTIGGTGIVGDIAYFALYNSAHSRTMRRSEELRLRQLYGVTPAPMVWCIGDSTTAGVGATNEAGYYPSQMAPLLTVGPYAVANRGNSGSTVAQWIVPTTGNLQTQVLDWITSDRSGDIAVLFIGGNDGDARGGAAIWGDIASMAATLREAANGSMSVRICTIAPRNNHNYEASGSGLNPLIRANARSAGHQLIDLTLDTAFDSVPDIATDIADATYYSDAPNGVHFTDAGYLKIATMIANALNSYTPGGGGTGRRRGRGRSGFAILSRVGI